MKTLKRKLSEFAIGFNIGKRASLENWSQMETFIQLKVDLHDAYPDIHPAPRVADLRVLEQLKLDRDPEYQREQYVNKIVKQMQSTKLSILN